MILFMDESLTRFMEKTLLLFMKFALKMMEIVNIKTQLLHCSTTDFIIFRDYKNIDGKSLLKLHQKDVDKPLDFIIYL